MSKPLIKKKQGRKNKNKKLWINNLFNEHLPS